MAGEWERADLLQSLGVEARDAAQVERSLLARATEQEAPQEQEAGDAAELREDALLANLKAVGREVRAVTAALEALDEAAEQEAQQVAKGSPTPSGDAKAVQPAQEQPPAARSDGLQRAGLAQRLEDLLARKDQWRAALAALRDGGEAAATPAAPGASAHPGGSSSSSAALQDVDAFAQLAPSGAGGAAGGLVETERDRLIRLGVLTPFDRLEGFERKQIPQQQPQQQPQQPQQQQTQPQELSAAERSAGHASTSGRVVEAPFQKVVGQLRAAEAARPRSKLLPPEQLPARERGPARVEEAFWHQAASGHSNPIKSARRQTLARAERAPLRPGRPAKRRRIQRAGDSADADSGSGSGGDSDAADASEAGSEGAESGEESGGSFTDASGVFDDADPEQYAQRLHAWRQQQRREAAERAERGEAAPPDAEFAGGFRVPGHIFARLFDYQRTGVKWLWELHTQRAGGIIGDEMGLGKTVQLAAFLAGLHASGLWRPALVVCPATVLRQWLRELRAWYPPFRVAILHDSARSGGVAARLPKERLVAEIAGDRAGVLLTTYEQLRLQRRLLLEPDWGCAILDEGHKIRNPDAEVTLVAKQLPTVHRVIMTGSPIQNRLTELWSLFDFVFPGKLGTLPVFQAQFALPIQIGGYSNASALQVSTAYKCAVVLRDLIAPYLLRRRKADVASQLPPKTEQVLFCSLTGAQRDLYRAFLASKECEDILNDRKNALAGIDILRKLCNHPDLLQRASWANSDDYGAVERSGKLIVAMKVLEHWRTQGHRALLFAQTQQMLDILERCLQRARMPYHRMDGSTAVGARARLIDDFNENAAVFAFLLTTKVGGIGVNLTGADRVLVYDPDWNPSTDAQARERAWRIGQTREVTVYRLITGGTIEEKVYHRQIYKQFLTNKVLRDPRQKRFFKAKDMSDLFQLGDQYAAAPETAQIFAGLDSEIPLVEAGQPAALTTPTLPDDGAAAEQRREGAKAGEQADGQGETHMLRELFEGTGVLSAMDHTKIEGANDPEALSLDAQAAKVARRAADAVRRSRAAVQAAPVNVPTWTGRHGTGGLDSPAAAPQPPPRFGAVLNPALRGLAGAAPGAGGPASFGGAAAGVAGGVAPRSADLLAKLRERQAAAASAGAGATVRDAAQEDKAEGLARRVVDFLAQRGGRAGSGDVVAHFADAVGPGDAALFRQVLQAVARLQRGAGGREWVLRPDFAAASQP